MSEFDWGQQEAASDGETAAPSLDTQPTDVGSSSQAGFSWGNAKAAPKLQSTGEQAPVLSDGLSPTTPINKSPVDIQDRLALALGNKKGVQSYLKSKFEDVQEDKSGKLLVKDKGLWHRVDPNGLGDGDAWERTNELIKDMADIIPSATKNASMGAAVGGTAGAAAGGVGAIPGAIGGATAGVAATIAADYFGDSIEGFIQNNAKKLGVGAGVLATAGLASQGAAKIIKGNAPMLAAGAIAEAGRTSLGRLVGTYDGDATDQIKDVAFETLLNLGGVTIGAGVKPTASVISNGLRKAGAALAEAPEATKSLAVGALGTTSGAGYSNTAHLIERYDQVSGKLASASAGARNSDHIIEKLTSDAIRDTETIADQAQPALSSVWKKTRSEILSNFNPETSSNIDDVVLNLQSEAVNSNFGQFVRTSEKSAGIDELISGVKSKSTNVVPLEEIAAHTAAGRPGLPEGVKFEMIPHEKIITQQKLSGEINELTKEESYNYVKDFMSGLKPFEGMKSQKGVQGADQLLKLQKYVGDHTYHLTESAKDEAMPAVAMKLKGMEQTLKSRIISKFDLPEVNGIKPPNPVTEMLAHYSETKDALAGVSRAVNQFKKTGSRDGYETLFKQITSKPGLNVTKKEGFAKAIEVIKQSGNSDMEKTFLSLSDNVAAKAFAPWVQSNVSKHAGLIAGSSLVTAPWNPTALPVAASFAATAAATSPKLNKALIGAAMSVGRGTGALANGTGIPQASQAVADKAAPMLVAAGMKGMSFLRKMNPEQLKLFRSQPQMVEAFFKTIVAAPQIEQTLRDGLVQHAVETSMPTPTQFPQEAKK